MGVRLFADSPAARGTSARPAASGAFERSSLARLMGGGSATRLRAVLPARGPRDRCRRRVHRPVGPFRVLPIHGSGQGGTPCPRVRGWCGCPGRRTSAQGRGRRARRSGPPFWAVRRRGRGDPPDRWSRSDPWCGPHCRATAHRRGSAVPPVRRAVLHRRTRVDPEAVTMAARVLPAMPSTAPGSSLNRCDTCGGCRMSDSLQTGRAATDVSTGGTAPTGVDEASVKWRSRQGHLFPSSRSRITSTLQVS